MSSGTSWYENASPFERRLFDRQMVMFPPNVSVSGEVRRPDGTQLPDWQIDHLKWIFEPAATATQEIVLPDPARFTVGKSSVSPRTVLTFSGMPNAHAVVSGEGRLVVHLGMLLAFEALPITFGLVGEMLSGGGVELARLEAFQPPEEALAELDALMGAWDSSSASGWAMSSLPPSTARGANMERLLHVHQSMARGMVFLVVGHELTHWFETIYKPAEWARMMREFQRHYATWLKEEQFLSRDRMRFAASVRRDRRMLDSWIREIHADCGAYDYAVASATHGGWVRGPSAQDLLVKIQIQVAFWFWLLTLFEIHAHTRGLRADFRTHPPAAVRSAVFCHVQAKRSRMSQLDFRLRAFGAGTAAEFLLDRIVEAYVATRAIGNQHMRRPG